MSELGQEVLIVRNDDKLEVGVVLAFVDDAGRVVSESADNDPAGTSTRDEWGRPAGVGHSLHKTGSERIDILRVKSIRRLIEGENATVLPE